MSVRFRDNSAVVKAEANRKAALAIRLMVDAIDSESLPHTPMRFGDLRRNKHKQAMGLHGSISWLQDYAVFQELKRHTNYTTPGTGPHFALNAVRKVVNNSARYFRQAGL